MYSVFLKFTTTIQVVSCDEALLDVSSLVGQLIGRRVSMQQAVDAVASSMRKEIFDATGCPCSVGTGENILLAKLATRKAKPNGQFFLVPHMVSSFMADLPVNQLPGVGWKLTAKLNSEGIRSACGQPVDTSLPQV